MMRWLLGCLLAAGLVIAQAQAAFVVTDIGQNRCSGFNTCAITVPIGGVPAGALIIVLSEDSSTAQTLAAVVDAKSNSYSKAVNNSLNNSNLSGFGAIWYAWNATALVSGDTITYTLGQTGKNTAVTAAYATGVQTSSDPKDSAVTASAGGASANPTVTSGTPSVAGELFIGAIGNSSSTTFTQASGWSTPPIKSAVSTNQAAGGNQVNAGTGTLTFNPTINSSPWAAMIMAFKAAPAVAGGGGLLTHGVGN